ncbi:MAG: serine/threonine-protein phosphatase [Bacteroidales bacterium]|nr:serine/threonine-protein phosphatase [Bacteroidales bacterium]
MSTITFKFAAKTDVGLVRTNNEDNLCAISNLDVQGSTWINNDVCQLGSKGALLVVADGMGGMNAGEVASEIAVSVVKERFTHEVNDEVLKSDESIVRFMNDTIVQADDTIKKEGKQRPEAKGMGTTIVIAWLYDSKLYVSWCGDSRAYIFNPNSGLFQISKDHSYVQELVDKGVVKPEDAFDFPESNVITRCLSHSSMKAEPDNLAEPYRVSEGDIVMLCTDGLSGMIRDYEIASVMAAHTDNMTECVDALIEAAKVAAGADNVTVCLCQVLAIRKPINRTDTAEINLASATLTEPAPKAKPAAPKKDDKKHDTPSCGKKCSCRTKWVAAGLTLLVVALAVAAIWAWPKLFGGNEAEVTDSIADTLAVVEDTLAVESTPDTSQLMIMNNL